MANQASQGSKSVDPKARHLMFDEVSAVWRSKNPTHYADFRVRVKLDRSSYLNRTRTKERRKPIQAWAFPDSGVEVCMIPPKMVTAMWRSGLVVAASMQIKDAGGHILPLDGAFYFK